MPEQWYAIVNSASGSASREAEAALAEAFSQLGRALSFAQAGAQEANKLAYEAALSGVDGIVACGGDGTVMRVVNGILKARIDVPLGILPLGTANIIARSLDLPLEQEAAIKNLLRSSERRIDLGMCNGEAFALGAGLGVAERFVTRTNDDLKRAIGPMAYLVGLLKELGSSRIQFRIDCNGKVHQLSGVACIVANAAGLGNGLKLVEEASVEDGLLDFAVIKNLRPMDAIRLAFKGIKGQVTRDWVVEHFQAPAAVISSAPPVPIQMDGDLRSQTAPFDVRVLPLRLRLLAPTRPQSAKSTPSVASRVSLE